MSITTSSACQQQSFLPFLFLFLSLLQFLQVLLGELDDVRRLLLRGQQRGGEGAGAAVERLAVGGARQILPQILANGLTLQEFGSEGNQTVLTSDAKKRHF